MRDEEARLDQLHDRYMQEAEKSERKAILADNEATRLEREARPVDSPHSYKSMNSYLENTILCMDICFFLSNPFLWSNLIIFMNP